MQGLLTWKSKFLITYKHLKKAKRYQITCVFISTKLKRDALEELALAEAKAEALCRWTRSPMQLPNRRPLSERPLHVESRGQVCHW
jgi:hypothetical protein